MAVTRANLLMSAQEVVASTLTNQDVKVLFDAEEEPYVDLVNRVIHLFPLPEDLTDEEVEDVRGHCDHEIGHLRHTNYNDFVVTATRSLLKRVANNIEDGRIERLMAEEWFGCGENLERSGRRALARIKAAASNDTANRRARAIAGLGLLAYGDSLDFVYKALGDDLAPLYKPVQDLLPLLPELKSTKEVVALATKLVDRWKWRADDSPISELIKTIDPINLESDDQTSEDEADGAIAQHSAGVGPERRRAVTAIKHGELKVYRPKTSHDRVENIQPLKLPAKDFADVLDYFTKSVSQIVPVLRRQLLMEFRSLGRTEIRDCRRGILDERVLHRVALGDDRLFYQEHFARVKKTGVSLLVDCSSSMTHTARPPISKFEPDVFRSRLFVAAQAAASMSWVLDLLGVPHECLAFTTARGNVAPDPNYERVRPLRHLIVKPFGKRYHACRRNFVSLALYEHCGENIDGEALLWAAQRLVQHTNSDARPALIIFSDGDPASKPEDAKVLAAHLFGAIQRVERTGIEILAVEIASSSTASFYKNRLVIRDIATLVPEFYKLLRRVLRDRIEVD